MTKTVPSTRRKYELTAKQAKKAKTLYGKGATTLSKLQAGLRKAKIPASRQSISSWMQAKGKGKRAASPFWKDVKAHMKLTGSTHKESTEAMKFSPKWKKAYKKRTGRTRLHWKDKDEIRHKLRAAYEDLEETEKMQGIEYEGETYYDTPK